VTRVPLAAWALGLAGLVPFLYAVAMIFAAEGALPGFGLAPASRAGGVMILERFGAAILGFMGGCLWGFASSRPQGPSLPLLAATALPAFLAFAAIRGTPALSCVWLAFGFAALQAIDVVFQRLGVAPAYWLTLRLPLTAAVIACLLVGALYG
jgi:hypothetical protein